MKPFIHILDIQISREEWVSKTLEERQKFVDTILASMTDEQIIQMAKIGQRVIKDDILQRADKRSRTALRTMARAVGVTVNEANE